MVSIVDFEQVNTGWEIPLYFELKSFKQFDRTTGILTYSTFRFLTFSEGIEIEHWAKMGL